MTSKQPSSSKGILDWRKLLQENTRKTNVLKLEEGRGAPVLSSLDGRDIGQDGIPDFAGHYLHLRLINFYHPTVRRGWLEQQPVVYSRAHWRLPSNGEMPRAKIIMPSTIDNKQAKKGGNFAFKGQSVFGPTLYNGGLDFSIGMLLRRSTSKAREALEAAVDAFGIVNSAGLINLDFDPTLDVVKQLVGWLSPDGDSDFLLGMSWDVPGSSRLLETGTWALLPGDEPSEGLWLNPGENRLMNADGDPVEVPYLVYSLDAAKHNPDRARIPEVSEAWNRVRAGLTRGTELSQSRVGELFKLYSMTVQLSEQLSDFDKTGLLQTARMNFEKFKEVDTWFEEGDEADLSSLDRQTQDASIAPDLRGQDQAEEENTQPDITDGEELTEEARLLTENKLAELIDRLVAIATTDPIEAEDRILDAAAKLRRRRLWTPIERLESRLRDNGISYPRLAYFGAAAHVELGNLDIADSAAARALMLADQDNSARSFNRSEALGLLGRIWKTKATREGDKTSPQTRQALRRAMAFYRQGDEALAEAGGAVDPFHKVNLLALTRFARSHGHPLGDRRKMTSWAKQIVRLGRKTTDNKWALANTGDALLYLGKSEAAAKKYRDYVDAMHDEPFALNGTRRNLVDFWEIDPEADTSISEIVREMAVASIVTGTDVVLAAEEVRAINAMPLAEIRALEGLIGKRVAVDADHLSKLVAKGAYVGRVCHPDGSHAGTGFLIPGATLHASFAGEMLFVTNDHVIRQEQHSKAPNPVKRSSAVIFFDQAEPDRPFQVQDIVWRSDFLTGSDCAVCRLYSVPDIDPQIEPFEPRRRLMSRWRTPDMPYTPAELSASGFGRTSPKVYVLGHPNGRDLSVSMHENFLIDHEYEHVDQPAPGSAVRLHYTAPTEPGSSGSPVLSSESLQLIALHHRGPVRDERPMMDMPPPASGEYQANEGHWFEAIIAELGAALENGYEPADEDLANPSPANPTPENPAPVSTSQITHATIDDDTSSLESAQFYADAERDNSEGEGERPGSAFEGMDSSDWKVLSDKPVAHWTEANSHPDTSHLAHLDMPSSETFELTAAVLKRALDFASSGPVNKYNSRVLFGIRGALPIHEVSTQGDPVFMSEVTLRQTVPDHSNFRCTMGVWDTQTNELWVTPASTVPAVGYMWQQAHRETGDANIANMMPPGIYRYKIGCHRAGSKTRQAGAFLQASKLCVMRSPTLDLTFGKQDEWDWQSDASGVRIADNIHGGLGAGADWAAKFYSAGCQVIDGSVANRKTAPQPTRLWSQFRQAAGLQARPSMKDGSLTQTEEDGNQYTYVLMPAKEVRIAAEHSNAPLDDPRFAKLRRGSRGEGVVAVQEALGLTADGDFGFLTQRSLLQRQAELAGENILVADGVVTSRNAMILGIEKNESTMSQTVSV